MNIAVINLMRLGDLIQTTPVLRCLRSQYPASRITLVAKDLFQEPARLLPGVDRLLTFPSVELAQLLDKEGGWLEAAQRLCEWVAQNFPQPPDLVINLTPNRLAGLLAYATGAPEIRGLTVSRDREVVTRPDWASYALVISRARQANPFNLVDLFLREGGLTPDGRGLEVELPPAAEQEAENFFQKLNLPPDMARVGLFPGASQTPRSWPPAQFARTAQLLLTKRPCHFFIFGSAAEAPLGKIIAGQLPASTTTLLMGRTSLPLLAAHLKRLNLLITNDTGPMHLAAAVGTPTAALFLASARVQDTGPVGKGHVIIEPHLDCHPCLAPCPQTPCHQAISPGVVAGWADKLLSQERLTPIDEDQEHLSLRVHLSATDPQGYQAYLPLVRRPLPRRDFWLWLHRAVWGRELDGARFSPAPLQAWLKNLLLGHYAPPREDLGGKNEASYLLDLCQIATRGESLAEDIEILGGKGGREVLGRIGQKIAGFQEVDQGLRRIAAAFPELASLVEFFFQEQRGREGTEVATLARALRGAYARLRRLGELAREHLAYLSQTVTPQADKDTRIMAQSVQTIMVNQEALPPESEGLSCR